MPNQPPISYAIKAARLTSAALNARALGDHFAYCVHMLAARECLAIATAQRTPQHNLYLSRQR